MEVMRYAYPEFNAGLFNPVQYNRLLDQGGDEVTYRTFLDWERLGVEILT